MTLVGARVESGSEKPYLARLYARGKNRSCGYHATREDAQRAIEHAQAVEARRETDGSYLLSEQDCGDPYLAYVDGRRRHLPKSPEIALWAALLLQALGDLCGEHEGLKRSAETWVRGEGDAACDFVTACEVLGLDPVAALSRALGLRGQPRSKLGWMAV